MDTTTKTITELLAPRHQVKPACEHWNQAYMRDRFDYNPDTGELRWKQGVRAGRIAGTIDHRYGFRIVNMDGHLVTASRIIWCWMTGEWLEATKHKNGVRDDNRFANLEKVERKYRGAVKTGDRWTARATVYGRQYFFGRYDTQEEAHAAYLLGVQQLRMRSEKPLEPVARTRNYPRKKVWGVK